MIPIHASQKLISKLFAMLCNIFVNSICVLVFIIAFSSLSTNLMSAFQGQFMKILSRILQEWDMALIIVFHILFGYLSLYIVFFFCIALTKSISHKNTIATLIGVASAIIIFVVWFVVGDKLDQLPIFTYYLFGSKSSFITYIFDFIVISALFIGTSWLMEKRIEH